MTLHQIESLALVRQDLIELLTKEFGYKFKLNFCTYYELSHQYGCTIEIDGKIFYARGKNTNEIAKTLRREVDQNTYVVKKSEEAIMLEQQKSDGINI